MNEQDPVLLTNDYFAEHAKDIEKVLRRAVNHALLMHKRLGNPIAIWKDGKVVIVPPEEIVISSEYLDPQQ
jgi:ABC-type proline/glycine betaine transport system ATPase subunit